MPKAVASKASNAGKAAPKKAPTKRKANGYQIPEKIPLGEILTDVSKQQWKIGPSIGSGGFGEIYCAVTGTELSKKYDDYPYVVKVEPHGNGPLFVEMHFYMRNGKKTDIESFRKKHGLKTIGMPHFVGHGSHDLNEIKHRFIVMPRFGTDVWNIFLENNRKLPLHTVYRLAIQMLDVYEYIHECTYVHGDLKGSNMLLGFGKTGGNQIYLVDFGLASHYTTKDFKPDPKKMHNGTIEYTSRDAHQGVPTMRGDLEILAYNLIQWAGGNLPWEVNKLLGNPSKVQEAKEHFMKNINSDISHCFESSSCPEQILNYTKYVSKLKYDEKPDYEKCRKDFQSGLKSLGKTSSGDLEFKSSAIASTSKKVSTTKDQKRGNRTGLTKISEKTEDDSENISPKPKYVSTKKRISNIVDDDEDVIRSPSKKIRTSKSTTRQKTTQHTAICTSSTDPSIVVNNHVNGKKTIKNKTYELNFELDISFDANVVVNVKRKPKKSPTKEKKKNEEKNKHLSIASTDEIPATEKSFAVGTAKILKRGVRTSPRSHK